MGLHHVLQACLHQQALLAYLSLQIQEMSRPVRLHLDFGKKTWMGRVLAISPQTSSLTQKCLWKALSVIDISNSSMEACDRLCFDFGMFCLPFFNSLHSKSLWSSLRFSLGFRFQIVNLTQGQAQIFCLVQTSLSRPGM